MANANNTNTATFNTLSALLVREAQLREAAEALPCGTARDAVQEAHYYAIRTMVRIESDSGEEGHELELGAALRIVKTNPKWRIVDTVEA